MGFNAFDRSRLAALNAEQAEQAAPGGLAPASPRNDYYIPQWEERTSYGVRRVDPYTKLFEDRIIFLGTPVTDDIANAVMAQLLCLQPRLPCPDRSSEHRDARNSWCRRSPSSR